MMYPPKSFFERILEGAAILALSAFLVRYAVCTIQSVWSWLILFAVLAGVIVIGIRIYRYYKQNRF